MGQRFPAGYPVAMVSEVIHDSGQPFAIVRAVPTAALNRSRHMLLVDTDQRSAEERATAAAEAQRAVDEQAVPVEADSAAAPVAPAAQTTPATPVEAVPAATPATPAQEPR